MKKTFLAFFLLFSLASEAQELRNHFTVPGRIENNIIFNFWQNPALTGYEERMNVQGGYGMKWIGLYNNNSPQNWFGAFEVAMGKRKINSVGVSYNHSNNGYEKRTELFFSYSATIRIRKINQLRIGLAAGYITRKIDWSQLNFGDQIDARTGFVYNTNEIFGRNGRGFPDFSGGIWFTGRRFYLGFSAMHLTQPDQGILGVSKLPMQLYYNAGLNIRITPEINLTPSFIASNKLISKHNDYSTFSPALSVSYKNRYLILLNYRNLNTLMFYVGGQVKENLRLTFGWGIPTSKELRAIQSGQSFEIMLRYRFSFKKSAAEDDVVTEEDLK